MEKDYDGQVVGGLYFKFCTQNDIASQMYCQNVLRRLLGASSSVVDGVIAGYARV